MELSPRAKGISLVHMRSGCVQRSLITCHPSSNRVSSLLAPWAPPSCSLYISSFSVLGLVCLSCFLQPCLLTRTHPSYLLSGHRASDTIPGAGVTAGTQQNPHPSGLSILAREGEKVDGYTYNKHTSREFMVLWRERKWK